jgi:hypothetical protein
MAMPWPSSNKKRLLQIHSATAWNRLKKYRSERLTGRCRTLGAAAGWAGRGRRTGGGGRRRGSAGAGVLAGAGIAIGVPAATLELKRAHGHDLPHRPITFGTLDQRRVRHPLLYLKHLSATVTLILIYRHCSTPSLTHICFQTQAQNRPERTPSPSRLERISLFCCPLTSDGGKCNAIDGICQHPCLTREDKTPLASPASRIKMAFLNF